MIRLKNEKNVRTQFKHNATPFFILLSCDLSNYGKEVRAMDYVELISEPAKTCITFVVNLKAHPPATTLSQLRKRGK